MSNSAFASGEARHREEPAWRCENCGTVLTYCARICDPCEDDEAEDRRDQIRLG